MQSSNLFEDLIFLLACSVHYVRRRFWALSTKSHRSCPNRPWTKCTDHASKKIRPSKRLELCISRIITKMITKDNASRNLFVRFSARWYGCWASKTVAFSLFPWRQGSKFNGRLMQQVLAVRDDRDSQVWLVLVFGGLSRDSGLEKGSFGEGVFSERSIL